MDILGRSLYVVDSRIQSWQSSPSLHSLPRTDTLPVFPPLRLFVFSPDIHIGDLFENRSPRVSPPYCLALPPDGEDLLRVRDSGDVLEVESSKKLITYVVEKVEVTSNATFVTRLCALNLNQPRL